MVTTKVAARCSACGAHIARDHDVAVCSPCRRRQIEHLARDGHELAQARVQAKATFERGGLLGLAEHLDCTAGQALDALISSLLLPAMTARRVTLMRGLVELGDVSHVAAAEALGISRWTVASYRNQLGLDKIRRSVLIVNGRST